MHFVGTLGTNFAPPGNRIAQLRKERGWVRSQVAGPLAVGETTVWRWERGLSGIPDRWKFALAELLDVDVPYLMGWTDEVAAS